MDQIESRHFFDKKIYQSLFFVLVLSSSFLFGQEKRLLRVINSNKTFLDQDKNPNFLRLIGDVVFEYEEYTVYCDSAHHFNEENKIISFGNVRMQTDSTNISCRKLVFDSKNNSAKLSGNVTIKNNLNYLFTSHLFINFSEDYANYNNGGIVIQNKDTIISKKCKYMYDTKHYLFEDSVQASFSGKNLTTNYLLSKENKEEFLIKGPSYFNNLNFNFYFEEGEYFKKEKKGIFTKNNFFETENEILYADTIITLTDEYIVGKSNVMMKSKTEEIKIFSSNCFLNDSIHNFKKNAIVVLSGNNDTINIESESVLIYNNTLISNKNVKIRGNKILGKCDSLSYEKDIDLIKLFFNPIIWVEEFQIFSDTIFLAYEENKLSDFNLLSNPFISNEEDSLIFNQISGQIISGTFHNNKLKTIYVNNNAQSIYLVKDTEINIGLNYSKSPSMTLMFNDGILDDIKYVGNVESITIPEDKINNENKFLKNFIWRYEEKLELFN